MKNVIIVESPTKCKTISSYLGDDYKVLSSVGHVCDLATTGAYGLGVDIENDFKPNYVISPDKKKVVAELKKASKDANVFLATDPDREGEAISYHLARILDLDFNSFNRIEFHEVTKPAILEAIKNPRQIDQNLVNSQETRRILDRIIGFRVSKLLQSKIKSQSAGRVQSVALKLVCDLEKEILAFVPVKYYEAEALFDNFKLNLVSISGNKERILDRKILEDLVENITDFTVLGVTKTESKRESKAPFTTSTLQQEASSKFGFSSSKTMMIAQSLYEGKNLGDQTVGLITYMRTDSTHLSDLFVDEASSYIVKCFGDNYLGKRKEKKQKLAQNAHEAIRMTSVYRNPEEIKAYLTSDEYKLYKLIYNRTLQSLMSDAKFLNTKATFSANNSLWECKGQELLFDGHLVISSKDSEDLNKLLPSFNVGDKYIANEINIKNLETKPKARYTEATLIKDMEDKGIGRPSTYAQTMTTLIKREYVKVLERKLIPTEQGIITSKYLDEFFPEIFNVSYTANLETDLDLIAKGEKEEVKELRDFYDKFEPIFDSAKENMVKLEPKKTGEQCPICGSDLVIRKGKYGEFVACSNYPSCKYIKKDEEEVIDTNVICPNCHTGHLIAKTVTRGKNKGNLFYACSNFPKCKTAFNDKPTNNLCEKCGAIMLEDKDGKLYCSAKCDIEKEEEILCPLCKTGHLVKRTATRGKNKGNVFYACSNFPKCKNIYNDKPTNKVCSVCQSMMLETKDGLVCSNENCKHKE